MTDEAQGLSGRIAMQGATAVERAGWAWAAGMRHAADALDVGAVRDLADTVERALVADGAFGLVDLAVAGPSLGGLDERDLAGLLAVIDDRAVAA